MKNVFRSVFLLGGLVISYSVFLILLFGGDLPFGILGGISSIVGMVISLFFLVFFINLSYPDVKRTGIFSRHILFAFSYIILSLLIWGIGSDSIDMFFTQHGFSFIGGLICVLGLLGFLQSKEIALNNRIRINIWWMNYAGFFVLMICLSLFLGFYLIGEFRTIPFTCDDIQQTQDDFLGILYSPIRESQEIVSTSKGKIADFLDRNVGELVGGIKKDSPSVGLYDQISQEVYSVVLDNKKIVDENVCGVMIDLIGDKWKTSGLQYSVIFLLFLLLYPLMSLMFLIVTTLSYVISELGKMGGLRKIEESMKRVQEFE